jgi:hypothetical protein
MTESVALTHAYQRDLGSQHGERCGRHGIGAAVVAYLQHVDVAEYAGGHQRIEDLGLCISGQQRLKTTRAHQKHQ